MFSSPANEPAHSRIPCFPPLSVLGSLCALLYLFLLDCQRFFFPQHSPSRPRKAPPPARRKEAFVILIFMADLVRSSLVVGGRLSWNFFSPPSQPKNLKGSYLDNCSFAFDLLENVISLSLFLFPIVLPQVPFFPLSVKVRLDFHLSCLFVLRPPWPF